MLSISAPIRSSAAVRYYVDLTNEDYMTAGGEPTGEWFGKSAEKLELRGLVDREQFRNVMNGFSKEGSSPLVQNAGDKDRQRGWDFVFSVPKSLSTLWSQADSETRNLIELSHREAVKETLRFVEERALWSRRGHAGTSREQVGMCAALFEHGTSRSGDPNLHTHAVIASLCVREDGTTGSILSKPLFTHKMATGAIYRVSLGAHLMRTRTLGLCLTRRGTNLFEVSGVSPQLIRTFSRRKDAIEKMLRGWKESGPVAAGRAAVLSRPPKNHVPREDLFKEWRTVGGVLGWSTKSAEQLRGRAKSPVGEIEPKHIRAAITQLSDFHAHFTRRDLTRAIADQVQAEGYSVGQVERAVARAAEKLFPVALVYGEMHFTTTATLRTERSLFARVIEGQHSSRHIVSGRIVGEVIGAERLSDEQKAAVKHITTTPGRVKLVSGLAGTGKSSMIAAARQAWEKGGLRVIGVALTGKAAEALQLSSGVQSFTLTSVLLQTNQPIISAAGISLSYNRSAIAPNAPHWSPVRGFSLPHLTFGIGDLHGPTIQSNVLVPKQRILSIPGVSLSYTYSPAAPEATHWNPVKGLSLPHLSLDFGLAHNPKIASVHPHLSQPICSFAGISLSHTRSEIAPRAPHWSPVAGLTLPHLTFGLGVVGGAKIDARTVVVVDEAGLVGTRQLADLLERIAAARAKVVLVGDPRQLPPIEAGAPFRSLSQRMGHAALEEIKRQVDPWARQVVKDLANGEGRRAIEELEARGRIHVERNKEEVVARLVNDWKTAGSADKNLVLASTRENVSVLNRECQEKRRRCGELKPVYTEHRDICLHPGDRVVFEANSKEFGVNNGSFGQILHVSGQDLIVKLDSGSKVTVPLDRYPHVSLGYAITSHKAQGLTCDNTFCYISSDFMGREMAYVQVSRARGETHLYLEEATAGKDLKGLGDLFQPGRLKMMAHDLFPSRGKDSDKPERQLEKRDPRKPEAGRAEKTYEKDKRENAERLQREELAMREAAEKERQLRKAEEERARVQQERLRRENEKGR